VTVRRAVFLDRDGTLMIDRGYLADPSGVELVPGAAHALGVLRARGALLVLVSNQSGVARGLIRPDEHERVHARFCELLAGEGVTLDGAYYCQHGPDDGCACRKPRPGMLEAAARERGIDLGASFMVGDKPSDVVAGRAAGCVTALFGAANGGEADLVARDWLALERALTERMA
jgi:D-glycero-D-manno-heptose 1,7-bisphosphate phosphatase